MVIDFSNLSANEYAAWWGATIATLALVWNIVVAVRSGARIKVKASPNMKIYPKQDTVEDKTYVSFTAVNCGTSPTTVTHFCGYYATSLWHLMRRKKQHFIITTHSSLGNTVPFVLAPGEEWTSLADQQDMLGKGAKGYLYLGIIHNQRKRPVYKRVKLSSA